ncbi:MAG: Holliday junction resolvase RuvX [Phycisphaerae bacterium]
MARWLGIDYGERRIGLALGDPAERIASPAATLDGTGTASGNARRVLQWAAENDVAAAVVGLPINMDGSLGPQAKRSQEFAQQLRNLGNLPVELWDERLSSFQADQFMRAAILSRSKRRKRRDALAAQVILQSFLDARRAANRPPEE